MASTDTSLFTTLRDSKTVMVLLHHYLPLGLSLWASTLVSLLKRQGRHVTVLVSSEPFGWGRKVDDVYPTDLVLSLEQLRQVISIPVIGESDSVGEISSALVDNNLEITVVPSKSALAMNELSVSTHGTVYDTVIGVGVSSRHALIGLLQKHQSSLSNAQGYFFGTFSSEGTLSEELPFIGNLTVSQQDDTRSLRGVLDELATPGELTVNEKEMYTLLIQNDATLSKGIELSDSEGYGKVGTFANELDVERMAQVFSGGFAKQNRLLQHLLSSAQKADEGNTVLYSISSAKLLELSASVDEVITILSYLPKFGQVKQTIVCVEERVNYIHVYVNGYSDALKRVAIKYGFPLDGLVTCGIVEGISFEKVCQDVLRVATKGELDSDQQMPTIIPVPIAIEPTLEEWENTAETDSGESIDATQPATNQSPMLESQPVPEPVAPQESTPSIPVSQGVDFAAIAKKMRESSL